MCLCFVSLHSLSLTLSLSLSCMCVCMCVSHSTKQTTKTGNRITPKLVYAHSGGVLQTGRRRKKAKHTHITVHGFYFAFVVSFVCASVGCCLCVHLLNRTGGKATYRKHRVVLSISWLNLCMSLMYVLSLSSLLCFVVFHSQSHNQTNEQIKFLGMTEDAIPCLKRLEANRTFWKAQSELQPHDQPDTQTQQTQPTAQTQTQPQTQTQTQTQATDSASVTSNTSVNSSSSVELSVSVSQSTASG